MAGLYIHVPFCVSRCPYCSFYSLARARDEETEGRLQGRYLDALERELAALPDGFEAESVFIGGGTPTELTPSHFDRLLTMVGAVAGTRVEEWSCEANPGSLTEEAAFTMRRAGVSRVSLGVQSFDDACLRGLGRIHSSEEAVASYRLLRSIGFSDINLDLMFALPGMDAAALDRQLDTLEDFGPDHVACYALTFEPGTVFDRRRKSGRLHPPLDRQQEEQFQLIRARLTSAGYEHYEISNFARPGHACCHNLLYWGGGTYLGCGPSACSHWDGERFGNVPDLETYCRRMNREGTAEVYRERLDAQAKARETLVMALRRVDGIDSRTFEAWTGYPLTGFMQGEIADLCQRGLLAWEGNRLRLSEEALFVSDAVFRELV
jgi:oxygen-independent coproporphyrinogen-3 oxidase